jgi:TonB-linked SusC/RagA family outer membrane protein
MTYDYDSRYFFDFSFGYNGSEKFTGENRYGFFPALGGGWIISNESFFEPYRNIVSNLKLKATWGKGGNDAIAGREGRFFFLSKITDGGAGYRWGSNLLNVYNGYTIDRYANPDITWEISAKYNYGLELSLFRNEAVKIQVDYFTEQRDQIYWERKNLPKSAGFEKSIFGNIGKVDAHGWDGSINIEHNFTNDLWIMGRGNFTYATNKIVEMDEPNYEDKYLLRKGYSVDQQWGLIAERLFVDESEINSSPKQSYGEYMAGDIKYKDVNGDGVVNDNDRVPMGYPTKPEIQYGYGLSMGYKMFDFSFFFQGNARVSFFINSAVGGGTDGDEGIAPFYNRRNALPFIAEDYWTETNPNIYAFWPRLSTGPMTNNTQQSTWWLRNGAFLRMKTVELGYNIPLSKWGLQTSRFYFRDRKSVV